MKSNLDRYKKDLDALIATGQTLTLAMQFECYPEQVKEQLTKQYGDKAEKVTASIPSFKTVYQTWYSEAQIHIKQLLPDRLSDFIRHYEKPKARKEIDYENYRIEDYLQDLHITRGQRETVVGPDGAIPHLQQQLAMVEAVKARFESSLFDIRQLVQADLFDSELEVASELADYGFVRAAGAVAGVVLERHLAQVCDSHKITIPKKLPTIAVLNDALKASNTIDVPQWRFVQHLADIRNLCDHDKKTEPTKDQVNDLLAGVAKVIKTIY